MIRFFDKLPQAVKIDGRAVPVNTDFRTALKILRAFGDDRLLGSEKISVMLRLLYPEIPQNTTDAVRQGLRFLNLGDTPKKPSANKPRLFSFEKDSMFIAAAFMSTYGIDLSNADRLHWWAFRALFSDLGSDCFFISLVSLRNRKISGHLSKSEKIFVRRNPDLFYLDCGSAEKRRRAAKEFIAKIGR